VTLMLGGQMPFSVVGGIDWVPAFTVSGEACILIEYGAGNASNRIKVDVAPGAIVLPPSTFVKASVVVNPTAVMALFPEMTMQAALVQGTLDGIEALDAYDILPSAFRSEPHRDDHKYCYRKQPYSHTRRSRGYTPGFFRDRRVHAV
jgi:hypothetical protein